jgi:hypothetical protein
LLAWVIKYEGEGRSIRIQSNHNRSPIDHSPFGGVYTHNYD